MDMGQEGTCDEINRALELRIGRSSKSNVQQSDAAGANDSTSCDGVKKESDAGSEEVERVSCRGCSDEEVEVRGRKKLRLSREQSALLEDRFREYSSISPKQRHALAEQLNLRPRQIEVWFQNRRARTRLKQMELDCQLLKKCCQKLTVENGRLQKEVQQLRAVKAAPTPSIYVHCPVAVSAAVCRSCGRRCDHAKGGNKNRSGEGA